MNHVVLLLTACINPGDTFSVQRRDSLTRLDDYKKSLLFFLKSKSIKKIIFCENSNFDLKELIELAELNNSNNINIEFLSFYGQPEKPQYGKGNGEMNIISYALKNSKLLADSNIILKVTGRLIVSNIDLIVRSIERDFGVDIYCDLRKNLSTSDSRIFGATCIFFQKYVAHI